MRSQKEASPVNRPEREQDEPMGEQEKLRSKQLGDEIFDLHRKDSKPDGEVTRNSCFIDTENPEE